MHASAEIPLRNDVTGSCGKRAMLEWLRPRLRSSRVPEGIGVAHMAWRAARGESLRAIAQRFGNALLAVRSDAAGEDATAGADAGRYRSVLGVVADDADAVARAIDAVFASYAEAGRHDEAFVQRQVTALQHACVAFTHALPDAAPYYVVSLAGGRRTDAVTRGDADVDTWYVARDRAATVELPDAVRTCLDAVCEVERIAALQACEIELVIDAWGVAWLLQARALPCAQHAGHAAIAARRTVEAALAREAVPPLLGMMPDWNPAELLGEHPRPLARTLFDRLVTRRAWAIGRAALGHAAGARPLLRFHAGRPYVDVRTSFRSLLPVALDADLGARLVESACARLRAHPHLHDKVEFDVVPAALRFGFEAWFATRHAGFDAADVAAVAAALREPLRRALDHARTMRLRSGFERDLGLREPAHEPALLAHWLARVELRTAARFAEAARQAFVLEALMRSAVEQQLLDGGILQRLRAAATADRVGDGDDDHVRAGTFEISAPARREWTGGPRRPARAMPAPMPTARDAPRLDAALAGLGITIAPAALFAHYAAVLRTRELGKFALARAVSLGLDALGARAHACGVARDDAGWLELDALLDPSAEPRVLHGAIEAARRRHAVEAAVAMPLLIDGHCLGVVHHAAGQPNYVGHGRVHGHIARVDATTLPQHVPPGSIIAIASADPGYDWIFMREPAALLTAFGGPNSHMAIRCAAAGVPALLGVGPEAFRRMADAATLAIDFEARTWTKA
ncbi:pyruvate phosphate dikinase-like enzyme [Dokdonella fugitiva]|jgi:phosphohistidine swiveling domain-containing protein|uniref:Pyruvate phosphate dikinase-like enzyme n=1 Tax=Dokdonella fugitiva TaxID=328517 RepID=A0A4R2IGA0_9GAMM|nr:pyruvate phosphate dikinase-like enzyme [Dokdonella fugitiva]